MKSAETISNIRSIAKNAGITGLSEFPLIILGFINGILVTRMLGAYSYGLYSIGTNVIALIRPILTLGIQNGIVLFVGKSSVDKELRNKTIRIGLVLVFSISLILALLILFSSNFISKKILNINEAWILRLFFPIIIYTGLLEITYAIFRAIQKVAIISVLQKIIAPTLALLANIIAYQFNFGLKEVILRDIIIQSTITLICIYLLNKFTGFLSSKGIEYNIGKEMLIFSFPLFLSEALFVLLQRIDIFMIGAYLSPVEVGLYNVILKINLIIVVPVRAIDAIVIPMLAENIMDKERTQWLYDVSCHWSMMATVPLVIIAITIPSVLLGVFGNEFSTEAGIMSLRIVSFGNFIAALFGSVSGILTMHGHTKIIFRNTVRMLLLLIPLEILMIPRFGIFGAALTAAFFRICWRLMLVMEVKKILKFLPPLRQILKMLAISLLVFTLIHLFIKVINLTNELIIASIAIILCTALYFISLYFFRVFIPEDRVILNSILSRYLPK